MRHTPRHNLRRRLSRRDLLRLGAASLTLPSLWSLRDASAAIAPSLHATAKRGFGRAKSCIVLFAWGGLSHIDSLDMKPHAGSDVRSVFGSIPTTTPGYHVCEHLPRFAKQTHRMTIVRSAHHNAPSHRSAAYWNLTGHEPPNLGGNWERSRQDWPCLGSMVAAAKSGMGDIDVLSGSAALPYPMYDGGYANGQHAGFLGLKYDPVIVRPPTGREYEGKSPQGGSINLEPPEGVDSNRMLARRRLLAGIDAPMADAPGVTRYHEQAMDLMLNAKVRDAFDIDKEPAAKRAAYGDHICGQSVLMARRLVDAGVPLATVYCAAGDLNGSAGAHFDTHGDGFNRLKNQMLPPLDQASAALLDDLASTGRLDETLVVWLTEFGRTPKVNGGGGRDHYPNCYSVAFAGAGVDAGRIYGSSDKIGAFPADDACGPPDLHATIFHALGIDPHFMIEDHTGRPVAICDGRALPIFG